MQCSKLSTSIRLAPPCGVATTRAMNAPGVCETMQQKPVEGASITQAYQLAEKHNPEPGFVTLSTLTHGGIKSRRLVPQEPHAPHRQPAVLLEAGSRGRRAFVDFREELETHAGITRHGYERRAWS